MKYSELDISKLNNSDIYDLVMTGIKDYSKYEPTDSTRSDFLIVLGCSPAPLKARVLKMIKLYEKGYGKYILFTGGFGWHKLFKVNPTKKYASAKEKEADINDKSKARDTLRKAIERTFDSTLSPEKVESVFDETEANVAKMIMFHFLNGNEIDSRLIFYEDQSKTTLENLMFSKELLDKLQAEGTITKVTRIMLVTSCFHCRRATMSFKKFFPDIDVISCATIHEINNTECEFTKENLMASSYYMGQFANELRLIIAYSRNGSIVDMDIADVIGTNRASEIEAKVRS